MAGWEYQFVYDWIKVSLAMGRPTHKSEMHCRGKSTGLDPRGLFRLHSAGCINSSGENCCRISSSRRLALFVQLILTQHRSLAWVRDHLILGPKFFSQYSISLYFCKILFFPWFVFQILVKNTQSSLTNRKCASLNDPHMRTFDGYSYELHHISGTYILYRSKSLPIQVGLMTEAGFSRVAVGLRSGCCRFRVFQFMWV